MGVLSKKFANPLFDGLILKAFSRFLVSISKFKILNQNDLLKVSKIEKSNKFMSSPNTGSYG